MFSRDDDERIAAAELLKRLEDMETQLYDTMDRSSTSGYSKQSIYNNLARIAINLEKAGSLNDGRRLWNIRAALKKHSKEGNWNVF